MEKRKSTHEIEGYLVVLAHVRNVYPVEEERGDRLWYWGFKYADGFFENFVYRNKKKAERARAEFIASLSSYWSGRGV